MLQQTVPCASGYLVLEDFAAPDKVAKLKQRAEEIIGSYDASNPSIFSTVNQVTKRMHCTSVILGAADDRVSYLSICIDT